MRTHPSSSSTTLLLITTTCLLSTPSSSEALLLPNLIGAISTRHRLQHRRQQQQLQRRGNDSTSTLNDGSITLTIDDEDPRGLWNIMSNNRSHHHSEQRRVLRFGFNWFRGSQHHHLNSRRAAHQQLEEEEHVIQRQVQQSIRPHGPVLRGGTLEDVILLPSSSSISTSSAAALTMAHSSATTTSSNKLKRGIWSHVRTTMRGIRHSVLHSSVSHDYNVDHYNNDDVVLRINPTSQNLFDRHGDGAAVNNMSVLRLGGVISRHLKHKKMTKKLQMNRSVGLMDGVEVVTSARGGDATTVSSSSSTSTSSSSASMSTVSSAVEETTFTIDTPLFPIILPKSWEAPIMGTTSSSSQTPTTTASSTYIESLEITIAPPESPTTPNQPTPTQLTQVTQPLIPTSSWETFTGLEFYQPQSYDGLVSTGVLLASVGGEEYVSWCGEKKTDKFVREHGGTDGSSSGSSWYEALDASQEVLVWSGKAIGGKQSGLYGAELPIIKSTSIIHKSPKYLAELLMDSSKVKAYNKMSLGREDVEVFQTGVDTTRGEGTFGNEGESKIVRNLTRPPMVNSNLEFVTCMHARKLSPQDLQTLSSNNNDPNQPTNGYIVVSRAVTGGQWNSDDSGNVRNEIILGVNILREVPNAPDKTEMIAVTHVYSPLIPLMLAKNAGVKGAVDFVRDIRSLP